MWIYKYTLITHVIMTVLYMNLDSWFDVCNSRRKWDPVKELRCGLGLHWEKQRTILLEAFDVVYNLRVKGHRIHMPWQKGFLISTRSFLELFEDMKEKYGISYVLTARTNQDGTENAFSVLRCMGGTYTNPTAAEFVRRLRAYLLGSCADVVVETAAVEWEKEDVVLTAEVGKGLDVGHEIDGEKDEELLEDFVSDPLMDHDYLESGQPLEPSKIIYKMESVETRKSRLSIFLVF